VGRYYGKTQRKRRRGLSASRAGPRSSDVLDEQALPQELANNRRLQVQNMILGVAIRQAKREGRQSAPSSLRRDLVAHRRAVGRNAELIECALIGDDSPPVVGRGSERGAGGEEKDLAAASWLGRQLGDLRRMAAIIREQPAAVNTPDGRVGRAAQGVVYRAMSVVGLRRPFAHMDDRLTAWRDELIQLDTLETLDECEAERRRCLRRLVVAYRVGVYALPVVAATAGVAAGSFSAALAPILTTYGVYVSGLLIAAVAGARSGSPRGSYAS